MCHSGAPEFAIEIPEHGAGRDDDFIATSLMVGKNDAVLSVTSRPS